VEAEFNAPICERYYFFDPNPLAAASLGQVHQATIPSQKTIHNENQLVEETDTSPIDVVVKVLRPNIEQIIKTDLAALRTVGGWLHRYRPIASESMCRLVI